MTNDVIWIVTDEPPQVVVPDGARDGQQPRHPLDPPLDRPEIIRSGIRYRTQVEVVKLEQNMAEFLQVMSRVVRRAQQSAEDLGGMELDEIELAVEVNAEGQLSLLGNGGKVGGKGAMTLKFKQVKSQESMQ